MFCLFPHLLYSGTLLCDPHKNFWVWELVQLMRNSFSAGKPIGKEGNSLLKPFLSWPVFSFLDIAPADPLFWLLLFLFPLPFSFLIYWCHGSMGERNVDVDSKIRTGQMWFCGICSTWEMETKEGTTATDLTAHLQSTHAAFSENAGKNPEWRFSHLKVLDLYKSKTSRKHTLMLLSFNKKHSDCVQESQSSWAISRYPLVSLLFIVSIMT